MEPERHRDREIVQEGPQRRALLVHVDKNLAEPAVLVFAGAQIDLVAADHGLLRIALAPVGQPLALAQHGDALDHLFHDALGDARGARRRRLLQERLDFLFFLLVGDELALQRLRQLRAVAVERVRLDREFPRQQIGRFAVLDARLVGHVDGLGDRAGDERPC